MFSVLRLLTIFLFMAKCNAEKIYNNNDWRPVSKEQILSDVQSNFIKTPEYFTASWSPLVRSENVYTKPHEINNKLMDNNDYVQIEVEEKDPGLIANVFKDRTEEQKWEDFMIKREYYTTNPQDLETFELTDTVQRKPKKIVENIYKNSFTPSTEKTKIIREDNAYKLQAKESDRNVKPNTYEVTEASEAFEVRDLLDDSIKGSKDQTHFKPNIKTSRDENLTSKLFSILGNYNIKTNDDLTNYAASRKKCNSQNSPKGYIYSAPLRHNSQNSYPIDSLLAVFLSNYGYYLSGLYGYPGNFQNIYGYLAANNIHNNKPFGAYKIYSDTDSSH